MSKDNKDQDNKVKPLAKNNSKKELVDQVVDSAVIADIPVELSNNLTLLSRKLIAYLNYFSAASLSRLNTLSKFIADAEDKLYNVNVEKLDMKELNSRYKEAKKAQAEIMTIAGQVSKQAVETENTARADEVYALLKNLSASTLEQLKDALTYTEDS